MFDVQSIIFRAQVVSISRLVIRVNQSGDRRPETGLPNKHVSPRVQYRDAFWLIQGLQLEPNVHVRPQYSITIPEKMKLVDKKEEEATPAE